MASNSGYQRITTFYADLSIAEYYEMSGQSGAIKDTFNRVCAEWINDYKFFTEFILCLNWKIWEHYEKHDTIARLYNDLWEKAQELFFNAYGEEGKENEEALTYYYHITD